MPTTTRKTQDEDLFAGLEGFAGLVAADMQAAAALPKPRKRAAKATPAAAATIPADKMVDPAGLAALGPGTRFTIGGSKILTFETTVECPEQGKVRIRTTTGTTYDLGPDERRLRVYTPEEVEYERRLSRLMHPGTQRIKLGTVRAFDVAEGTYAEVAGRRADGSDAGTLVGYIIEALRVVKNYQGWTTDDHMVITVAEHPEHLDGVPVEMPLTAEIDVLDTNVPSLTPLPPGTPAPWKRLSLEDTLAAAGLGWGPENGPGVVSWRLPYMTRGSACPDELEPVYLSHSGGPVGNARPLLKQKIVDKAVGDGVWPGPVEAGPVPLNRVREGAHGTLTGRFEGCEQAVTGEFMYFWTRSHGVQRHDTVAVMMRIDTGRGERVVEVEVPATGAVFHLGADQVPGVDEPADLLALLAGQVADDMTASPQPRTIPLADAEPGMYGILSSAWGPASNRLTKDEDRTGYIIERVRVYTGGITDLHGKGRKFQGLKILHTCLSTHPCRHASVHAPLDATFTILEPPAGHEPPEKMHLGFRAPARDVLPGDVFNVYGEPGWRKGSGPNGDDRARYHVQALPEMSRDSDTVTIQVTVNGVGDVLTRQWPAQKWVDVEDPRTTVWRLAGAPGTRPVRVDSTAVGRRAGDDDGADLVAGDVILGEAYTPLLSGKMLPGFAGVVAEVSDLEDRDDEVPWVTISLTDGTVRGFPVTTWFYLQPAEPAATSRDDRRAKALDARITGYAAKFAAETVSAEPPTYVEPTDEALMDCLKHCARLPKVEQLPAIREAFTSTYPRPAGDAVHVGDGLDAVRDVLARAEQDGTTLRIPAEKLPRAVWEALHSLLKALGASGGSRRGQPYQLPKADCGLATFIAGGPAPLPERTSAGWVRTPAELAATVVARFVDFSGVGPTDVVRVLEPSAGDGALVRAVIDACPGLPVITAIEPDDQRRAALHQLAAQLGQRRFASVTGGTLEEYAAAPAAHGRFGLVVMNPPYAVPGKRALWIEHVQLAWKLLAVGGQLVAILPKFDRDSRGVAALLRLLGAELRIEPLDERAFRESGTDVSTCVISAVKPGTGRQMFQESIYRRAEGTPVRRVDHPQLTAGDALTRPVQAYRDFGGEQVARYVGKCIGCGAPCWSDGSCDPRGVLGFNANAGLRAGEHDLEGPEFCMCGRCGNYGNLYQRAYDKARKAWREPAVTTPEG